MSKRIIRFKFFSNNAKINHINEKSNANLVFFVKDYYFIEHDRALTFILFQMK